jgi:uncharacterized membrane protein YgdD (TMEM256/DUF423 family)
MTARTATMLGAALAGTAVATGALAAHALRSRLEPDLLEVFATAARYQMIHGIALIVAALAAERWPEGRLEAVWWMFLAGTIVFSGSLYLIALTGMGAIGAITPIGGVLLIAGWATFAWRVARS